ncbi:HDOD domain-containing protein [Alteromonas sp. ASW11-130]|uniref:HDOD domain-containing protein n=1 Tax=Alteromonas sp. ASW11-130 TaxID=3015775 RepID=UPI002241C0FE|nr:HDOD domain-containing protein [Alteromonas sp. ASW11-130]MCW8090600.1 HDOD domain-containing protein [Alteromonas sp. ASW11-130]
MSVQDIAVNAKDIYVLPDAVTRLKECLDDNSATIDDIADIISFDPALAAQILKVSNSALYRFPNKIETISKALQVIGTRAAYDLALAYGVTHAFSEVDGSVIDLDKFWEQSVSCGLLAKFIAEQRGIKEPERLFVAGLLHNIGELVISESHPKQAERCQAFNERVSPAELQHAILDFTYAELSAELVKQWGIPESIYRPVNEIHQVFNERALEDERILQLSYVLALDNVNPEIYPSYSNLEPHLHESLALEIDDLEDALDITNLQCLSVISLFNPSAFMLY